MAQSRASPSQGKSEARLVELRAVEVEGTSDAVGRLAVDEPVRATRPGRVRLIALTAPAPGEGGPDSSEREVREEREWIAAAAGNLAFASLSDPAEDTYTTEDGRPFRDQG